MVKVTKSKESLFPKLTALALIIGTSIGAGILGLPYLFAKSGFLGGAITLVVVGIAMTLVTLYFGEISLRTKENYHLSGFAKKYLGNKWKYIVLAVETIGIYAILIAYLIGIGMVASQIFGINATIASTIFFVLVALAVFFGYERTSRTEFLFTFLKIALLVAIIAFILPGAKTANLGTGFDWTTALIPIGVAIFAFNCYTVLPEIETKILHKDKKSIWYIVIAGMAIVLLFYLVFSYVFLGNFGTGVSEVATNSLIGKLAWAGALFVLITLVTPFIALTSVIKDIYTHDLNIDRRFSWFLACFVPYMIFLYGGFSFVSLISYAGVFAFGLLGVITVYTLYKARQNKPEVVPGYVVPGGVALMALTALVFVAAIVYQLLLFVGIV
ncbi:MAG: aromatic amino acid transport family protein [Candidatus Nanoarchaeia archaeon]|nr:aromatic amino acid transport family protein [Candidatus Nanoarchaeia archaeon]MDD5239553.1 aromatic amino acid transport family protein [Candidatus Nanoarchaeia archaeon]